MNVYEIGGDPAVHAGGSVAGYSSGLQSPGSSCNRWTCAGVAAGLAAAADGAAGGAQALSQIAREETARNRRPSTGNVKLSEIRANEAREKAEKAEQRSATAA